MTIAEIDNVLKLPVEQRILLVEDVWDSIRPNPNEYRFRIAISRN